MAPQGVQYRLQATFGSLVDFDCPVTGWVWNCKINTIFNIYLIHGLSFIRMLKTSLSFFNSISLSSKTFTDVSQKGENVYISLKIYLRNLSE